MRSIEVSVSTSDVISTPLARVAAVVDRSADFQQAAKDCVRARFSFGGQAAYAPDVVLVNEFSTKAFCSAVAEAALSYLTSNVDAQTNGSVSHAQHLRKARTSPSADLQKQLEEAGASVLASGTRGSVVLCPASSRSSKLLTFKITEPVLLILPISSLDDAIDLLNSTSSQPLLAAHVFAAPDSAKYLSQFVNASASFINTIPAELLVGPPAPNGFTLSVTPRYTPEMFSKPHPELFQHTSGLAPALLILLEGGKAGQGKKEFNKLHDVSLPPINESTGPPIGFFEQGLFVGAGLVLSTIVVMSVVTVKYVAPAVTRRIRT